MNRFACTLALLALAAGSAPAGPEDRSGTYALKGHQVLGPRVEATLELSLQADGSYRVVRRARVGDAACPTLEGTGHRVGRTQLVVRFPRQAGAAQRLPGQEAAPRPDLEGVYSFGRRWLTGLVRALGPDGAVRRYYEQTLLPEPERAEDGPADGPAAGLPAGPRLDPGERLIVLPLPDTTHLVGATVPLLTQEGVHVTVRPSSARTASVPARSRPASPSSCGSGSAPTAA